MRALCREADCLPTSFVITGRLSVRTQPISQSAISDVYKGTLNKKPIALKTLRIHRVSMDAVKKVCLSSRSMDRVYSPHL